ncbi:3',5'-cyclic-AMP phosphodiesterase [Entomomonas asaccharolytica]|uniref:3',5'-cyclic-AMP phosphodiesterase n=1 Tax=Entomomonas asaccharolytica TaxID=2785331 RepID=A0A974RYH4_9GAMM|nr:3',5'-cyclic-AMP phosphodiesterase [Entomomonas asaccharolytica]QQP85879.1 3',5'-cyclic-AMP phosphodiesterase [Entomomonas asaccharolytica]
MTAASHKDYLLCVQLTDPHLFANPQEKLLGVTTAESLKQVVTLINEEQSAIDLVLVTGDISQDGSIASYQFFQEQIKRINAPSLWTSGNHDDFSVIQNIDSFQEHLITQQDIGEYWRVITLNSQVIGENYGKLPKELLENLLKSLQSTKRFHLIGIHHPAFATNARWLNDIRLQESWEFLDCLEYFLNANVVLCGHIHQVVELYYRGTYLFSSPSTCIQFAPDTDEFKLDNLAPGYRWIKLFNNGHIDTGISRLKENPFTIDSTADSY